MYYFVIGADGKRYGPADVDALVTWVEEGRIVASTWLVERGTDRELPADALPAVSAALRRVLGASAPVAVERGSQPSDTPTITRAFNDPNQPPPGAARASPTDAAALTPPANAHAASAGFRPVTHGEAPLASPGQPSLQPHHAATVNAGAAEAYARGLGRIGPKSKLTAGLLGIFLGWLGIHRFYLGYTGIGILQIVVTIITCGAGWLWGLIEGIICLCGGMRDADGLELRD